MLIPILLSLAAIVVVLAIIIALQPTDFRITRSATLPAPPVTVFAEVNDFHRWEAWSPWAKLDPAAKNTFSGAPSGEGASFAWDGNNQVGAGRMTITESRPDSLIRIRLEFLRPFQAVHTTEFTFAPAEGGTLMTWTMSGRNNFVSKAMVLLMNCDKRIGGQFEKGLENLRAVLESEMVVKS